MSLNRLRSQVPLLEVLELSHNFGGLKALTDFSLTVETGELVGLIGPNGAGKSTILRAISGLIPISRGSIAFTSRPLKTHAAHHIAQQGIVHVPEGRGIFGNLTVLENLRLATYGRRDDQISPDLEHVLNLFPRLAERGHQLGNTLSGGEQQMPAVGRALMRRSRLLLLDKSSMGLAPLLVREVFKIISEVNRQGTTVLLVEQNANMALTIAHRGYVLETGQIILAGSSQELARDPVVRQAYPGH
ncbi:MAG: ABC transporter ATP-binding protein [Deltaproteobacteria bacterium]|nr:ABC transporter ATP-binding protein [Deltaproteobacteria bacterium]